MKYNLQARVLHWLSALVILWATVSGFSLLIFDFNDATVDLIAEFNVAITTLFVPFFIWRIVNRLVTQSPDYPSNIKPKEVKLAFLVQVSIYLFVSVVLISGILMMDRDIHVFGLFEISQIVLNVDAIHTWETIHQIATRGLALLIGLHLLAFIRHEFVGNKILKRML